MTQRPAPAVKVLFLIRTAMTVGVISFIGIAWLIRGRGQAVAVPPASAATLTTVMYLAVGLAAAAILALRLRLASATPAKRRSLSVVSWAVGEFAALFGGGTFFLTGDWQLVLPGALVFALSLAAVPLPREQELGARS
ncbi:MAG TPA: hypothetical protein VIK25_15675 [Gemmatimonadaceae bacterium]